MFFLKLLAQQNSARGANESQVTCRRPKECYKKGFVDEPPAGNCAAGAPAWKRKERKKKINKNPLNLTFNFNLT